MGDLLDKKSDILYFDKESQEVKIKDDCMTFKEVYTLLRRDKSMGKKYFYKCISYCYYMNHSDSPIVHQPYNIKKKNVLIINEGFLSNFDDENTYYSNFEKWFIENHFSALEIRYKKLIKDIDALIEHLTDIPLYKRMDVTVTVTTTECIEGEAVSVDKNVKVNEVVDNSKEKTTAITNIKALDDLREMLVKKIKVEYTQKGKGIRRMFDR